MDNPFSLSFGKEPQRLISRNAQMDEIMETFQSQTPPTQVYVITGVRGYGKTVMLTTVSAALAKEKDWIVVPLNPARDLIQSLVANLYDHASLKRVFSSAKLNLSAFGVGVSIEGHAPVADIENALRKMLGLIKKAGKRLLITIDEVSNTEFMRVFAGSFQMLLRENYPVFLLMTGLFENIRNLQNEDALTFLYRAPRIELKPLSVSGMAGNYREVFGISSEEAKQMAVFTKGYPYAFQVLGFLRWKYGKQLEELTSYFDEYMEQYAYEKIWSELSNGDKDILRVLAQHGKMKTKEIQEKTGHTSSSYSMYRRRLKQKGLIDTSEYGYAELTLPRFDEFVRTWCLV